MSATLFSSSCAYLYPCPYPIFCISQVGAFDVERTAAEPVPLHLWNAPTRLMQNIGYGQGYRYAHELENKVADMQCLPDNLRERQYYLPTNEGIERRIRDRLKEIKRLKTGLPPQETEAPSRSKQRPKKES